MGNTGHFWLSWGEKTMSALTVNISHVLRAQSKTISREKWLRDICNLWVSGGKPPYSVSTKDNTNSRKLNKMLRSKAWQYREAGKTRCRGNSAKLLCVQWAVTASEGLRECWLGSAHTWKAAQDNNNTDWVSREARGREEGESWLGQGVRRGSSLLLILYFVVY